MTLPSICAPRGITFQSGCITTVSRGMLALLPRTSYRPCAHVVEFVVVAEIKARAQLQSPHVRRRHDVAVVLGEAANHADLRLEEDGAASSVASSPQVRPCCDISLMYDFQLSTPTKSFSSVRSPTFPSSIGRRRCRAATRRSSGAA